MNKEQFIDTLRRALYGKIDDYTLQDHIRYYEDYIRQEMGKGRTEQEVLQELGAGKNYRGDIFPEESGYCLYS